ncbi:hypothetical protein BDV95DRAFT_322202 [Massariosphaeria phaeospora]|uniref:Uncharacterized protein n=1 Tax=Massariosphaeria phaeospora TaxID=100035 RepID=A0A7C8MB74_9PLEO|nr:hypothetical protein BDV95DRAFT_322202 [Massariosphaeria phaeospora]
MAIGLTLPPTAPGSYLSQDLGRHSLPTLIYTLVALSEDELEEVNRACQPHFDLDEDEDEDEEGEEGEAVRLAPEPLFVSQPLSDVYESHLQRVPDGEFDPIYFIVVVDKDWKKNGVLLVTLMTDDEPPGIDSFFCKPEEVGSAVVNLQIANTDWEECRESCEVGVGGEEEDDDEEDDEEDEEKEESKHELPTDADEGQSEDEGPEYPSKKPAYDYLIPIYFLDSVDADAVISSLEEDVQDKPNAFTDYRIRNQASLKPTVETEKDIKTLSKPDPLITSDLVAQASALHPIRCRANKWLNKTYFLVCDNTQPSTAGIVIVKLVWDGVTKGRSKAQLREIGSTASHETTRREGTSAMGITYGYKMIVDDSAIMSRTHPAFAVFQLNSSMPHHGVKVVDPPHWDRKIGDEFFIPAGRAIEPQRSSSSPAAPPVEDTDVRWTLQQAVDLFPWFCYDYRFTPLLNRQYFLWFDLETVEDEGVVLVRYDWDGDIERSEVELWDLRELDAVRTMRVPAGEAMAKIERAAKDGSDDWAWEVYKK